LLLPAELTSYHCRQPAGRGSAEGEFPLCRGLQGVSPCLPNNLPGRAGGKNHALWQQRQQGGGRGHSPQTRQAALPPSATNPLEFALPNTYSNTAVKRRQRLAARVSLCRGL